MHENRPGTEVGFSRGFLPLRHTVVTVTALSRLLESCGACGQLTDQHPIKISSNRCVSSRGLLRK
eukprot:COSAG02_NODE_27411_length_610_cov_1.054795_1_plen_64_part_10